MAVISSDNNVTAIVLAAGLGKRLAGKDGDSPKCMRVAGGRPLLWYTLNALGLPPERVIIVVGYKKEEVINAFPEYRFAEQKEQRGTGHAAAAAAVMLRGQSGTVVVSYGDMPMFSKDTYKELIEKHISENNDCTILADVYESGEPPAFGRIVRKNGEFVKITEAKDCTPDELKIKELNAGIYAFKISVLLQSLQGLSPNNAQGELYLTDCPELALRSGGRVAVLAKPLGDEILGVNTPEDLKLIDSLLSDKG